MADDTNPPAIAVDDVDLLFVSDKYLSPGELQGRDLVVVIAKVSRGVVTGEGGRKATKGLVLLEGREKPWVLNKTCARIIKKMYGRKTRGWVGKPITLYPTTTVVGDDPDRPCIRVRPEPPQSAPAPAAPRGDVRPGGGQAQGGHPNAPR